MPSEPANDNQREFRCIHCHGKILVPRSLPSTTGPCPHCQKEITSPGPAADPKPEIDPIFGKPVDDDTVGAPPPIPVGSSEQEDLAATAERSAKEEAERKAAEEAERKAEEEAERKAAEEAEQKAKEEAERKAAEEAEQQAKEEAERKAAEETERKAKEEAEREAAEEAARKAEEEAEQKAEQKAKEEAEQKAKEEAERKAAEEAEQKAKEEAERKAAEEAEQKAKEEAERKAAEEAEQKAKEEAERKAAEEAEQQAKEEAERKAAEETERKAKEEAEREAAEEAARKAEEEAEQKAAEEAEQKAKEEAERKAAEEAEQQAKEEAERKAAEEAEQKAKEEAERKAAEEAEQKAKEEVERKAAEEAEQKAREDSEQRAAARAERRAAEVAEHQARDEADRKESEKQAAEEAEAARKVQEVAAAREASQREKDKLAMGFASSPLMAEAPLKEEVVPASAAEEPVAEESPEPEPPVAESAEEVDPPKTEKSSKAGRKRRFPVAALLVLIGLLALAGGSFVFVRNMQEKKEMPTPMGGPNDAILREKQYLEKGWEDDAYETLARFLEAKRPAGKAAYSINGSSLMGRMESFYQSAAIDDSDTPAEAFSVFPLSMQDRERGIFMLIFDQPPVFEIDEFFAPLAPLDVQYKLREPDMLLATVARSSNFAAEPLKVQAIFKRTAEGLRLDWETFVQTKYRTLRDFLELPVAGREETFRVIISETVPEKRNAPAGHRTYLVSDPAHRSEDSARVNVPVDSEVGRALSILNWRGTPDGRAVSKTATLKLRWTREEIPRLEISHFICWEFLGVGGEAVESSE